MSDQPEALRLAAELDCEKPYYNVSEEAAAELRRQHSEIEALKAERDALRADAERYQWLRDWKGATHDIVPTTGRYGDRAILCEELDAAIDAARSKA